jgi:hypothetical protein
MVKTPSNTPSFALVALAALSFARCDKTGSGTDGGPDTFDATVPNTADCPGPLPEAAKSCSGAACTTPQGSMKEFGEATLDSSKGHSWIVVTWAVSESQPSSANANVMYAKTAAGALSPAYAERLSAEEKSARSLARARRLIGDLAFEDLFQGANAARIRGEAAIRAIQRKEPYQVPPSTGTAIRDRTSEILPPNVRRQGQACSAASPSCGDAALCVIPEGATDGNCSGALMLKFRTGPTSFDMVNATVKRVGMFGAIVVDDQSAASIQQADIDALSKRFDEHVAPLDHMFFGQPRDAQGHDRDGNGVVIIFLTPRVAARAGNEVVGFFQKDDLLPTSMEPTSNAADILYMQPPSSTITLDQVSGTLAHEYQHMINFYAKKILNNSSQEDVWLDEGLATFAEDVQGYGSDSFKNVAAYLMTVDQTSLTGFGLTASSESMADNASRRGMAMLLVRYLFEQKGGAKWGTAGADVTDKGGIAAVKKLVQSADTGTLNFTEQTTGRKFGQWVGDLLTTAAVSGAGMPGVSCNPKYHLLAPETDAYTHYQRGIDLRRAFMTAGGMSVMLKGPNTTTFENESSPLPTNGGEVRTLAFSGGTTKVTISGSADYEVDFHALPTDLMGN